MSTVLNSSCFRAGRQSITNTKSVRPFSPSGRSISSSFASPNLRSPKPDANASKKMTTFTSLDVNGAAISGLFRPDIHSAQNHGRSISLFLPSSSVLYDLAHGADMQGSYSSFSKALACASLTPPTHVAATTIAAIDMSLDLAISTPLPLSPTLTTEANDTPPPPIETIKKSFQSYPSVLSLSPSRRNGPRHALPSICLVTSKSSSLSSTSSMPSPTARARRAASPSRTPPMYTTSSNSKYVLNVQLPIEIKREMVTVSAKKGDRIAIVADAWHMEEDCHYEWQIRFSPHDINMASIRVIFDDEAQLSIHVERRNPCFVSML